ncbi:MAG: PAS domain S-box protein [Anaerolineae bacterium]|nr:PAS domain S-box protein [Anaerolineae bacterium]
MAALLNTMLLIILGATVLVTPILVLVDSENLILNLSIILPAGVAILGLILLLRYGWMRLTSILFLIALFTIITLNLWFFEGSVRGVNTGGYFMVIIIAALLLGGSAAIIFGALSILTTVALYVAEINHIIVAPPRGVAFSDWLVLGILLIVVTLLLRFAVNSINQALIRARKNEQEAAIFRSLAENATDGIFMSTPDGKVTYGNRAGYELFGLDYEEQTLHGIGFSSLIPAPQIEAIGQEPQPSPGDELLHSGSWRGEAKQQRQDGSAFDAYSTTFSICNDAGAQVALAAIIRDITEQKQAEVERQRLQQEVIEAQRQTLKELSTPIIPVMDQIIVMPLIGSVDTLRAGDITRALLKGITDYRARIVIVDITGVPLVDSGVANHLNKTIQAARLKGAQTIITGISDAVAETIVDLGIDWSGVTTLSDLQTGLMAALDSLGVKLIR